MARKSKETLKEAPPPADSSSEEETEQEESEQEEDQPQQQPPPPPPQEDDEQESSEDEEEEESEEEEEDGDEENPPSTPPPPSKSKKPTPSKSKPRTTDDSDPDSDSDSPPSKIKPLPSKSMTTPDPKSKTQKPKDSARSKPTVAALAAPSGSKRSLSNEGDNTTNKKAKKDKAVVAAGADEVDNGNKKLFQRLWSEEDEIATLKAMIDYKNKKGEDPLNNYDDLVALVHESCNIGFNRTQIVSKVRRLKKKYLNALKKKKITDPHEMASLELSKQIWGDSGGSTSNGDVAEDHKDLKSPVKGGKAKGKSKGSDAEKELTLENGKNLDEGKRRVVERKEGGEDGVVVLRRGIEIGIENGAKEGLLNEAVVREGLKLVDEEKRAELEEKWRKFNVLELEMSSKRLELYQESVQLALDALKAADR